MEGCPIWNGKVCSIIPFIGLTTISSPIYASCVFPGPSRPQQLYNPAMWRRHTLAEKALQASHLSCSEGGS